jgi:hypothetical protein
MLLTSHARRAAPRLASYLASAAGMAAPGSVARASPAALAAAGQGRRAIASSTAAARDFGGGYYPPSTGRGGGGSPFADAGALSTVNYGVR